MGAPAPPEVIGAIIQDPSDTKLDQIITALGGDPSAVSERERFDEEKRQFGVSSKLTSGS